jgi:hypothetical protein
MHRSASVAACVVSALASTSAVGAATPNPPDPICVNDKCTFAEDSAMKARSAAAFVDSIGVNVHFSNPRTPYVARFPEVKQKLLALGVRHLRDAAVDRQGQFWDGDGSEMLRELGSAGMRFTLIFRADVPAEFVQGFPARVAPAFEAYEFPNEANAGQDSDWARSLRDWGERFRSYVRSGRTTARYPIVGPSLEDTGKNPGAALGEMSAFFDYGNAHVYYSSRPPGTDGWGGRGIAPCTAARYGSTSYAMCNQRRVSGTKPIVVTESGWGTDVHIEGQVPEDVQAKYLARMLLLHFDAGIRRTFIYQLVDSASRTFHAYGLLSETIEEKPSFVELRQLIGLLRDAAEPRSLGTLRVALKGDTTELRTMLLQKSDGSFRLLLWIERPAFDPVSRAPIAVTPGSVSVGLGEGATVVATTVFDADGNARTLTPRRDAVGRYALTITDNLTILHIKP